LTTRTLLSTLVLLAGAAVVGVGPASAATGTAFVSHPVSVGGYTMRVVASRGDGTRVSVVLFRVVGTLRRPADLGGVGSIQQHEWRATRARLTASRGLHRARLRARLGSAGRIDMKFRASGRTSRGRVPWCATRRRRISGTLRGSFELRTGPGFGTIVRRRLPASLSRGSEYDGCYAPPIGGDPCCGGQPTLHLPGSPPGGEIDIWNAGGGTFETVRDLSRANERHEIVARSAEPVFSYSSDLRSASVTGIGPFVSGALSFAGAPSGAGGDSGASGNTTGDFTAHLAAPRPFTVPSGAPGSLFAESP